MDNNLRLKLINSLNQFVNEDRYLLENNLNERAISHKLGCYMQHEFENYHVDCEYNRNCEDELSLTKKIYIRNGEFKSVYPDIIVHKRGTNLSNKLIVECKKSNNRNFQFDREKMKYYTSTQNGNLGYEVGVNIIFNVGSMNDFVATLVWYSDGLPIKKEYLIIDNNLKQLISKGIKVPTYEEIQRVIRERYDCSIKTCWIADAKESLALPVKRANNRINYDYRENKCPEETFEWLHDLFMEYGLLEDIR